VPLNVCRWTQMKARVQIRQPPTIGPVSFHPCPKIRATDQNTQAQLPSRLSPATPCALSLIEPKPIAQKINAIKDQRYG